MRKIVANEFISVDGVIEAPDTWTAGYFDDEVGQDLGSEMATWGAMLLGRTTYDVFASSWPEREGPMADVMNGLPKLVVSTTLQSVDWHNSSLIKDNVIAELRDAKQQPGKDISIPGSSTLVRSLLVENLIDEIRLLVVPIVVGTGQRLFDRSTGRLPLELIEFKSYDTGVLKLRYRPVQVAGQR